MKVLVCLMMVCLSWVSSANLSCNCGWRNTGRMVGGKEAPKNVYPWMAYSSNGCGASILTPYHVLTAAHCTYGRKASEIKVSAGMHYKSSGMSGSDLTNQYVPVFRKTRRASWMEVYLAASKVSTMYRKTFCQGISFERTIILDQNRQKKNPHLQQFGVAKIIQHKDYDNDMAKGVLHDIAILVLATPIRFNQFVGPVCLPSSRFNLVGKFIKLTGWGSTMGTADENALREADLEVISNSACKRFWPMLNNHPTQNCVHTPKKASCQGDSGGPLVYLDPSTNRYTQVALVSYGAGGCSTSPASDKPSVNTDVFAYMDWIKKAIAQTYPKEKICTKV